MDDIGRPPNPDAKRDLLERAAAYTLTYGLSDLSLRPLASALGVSPRLLLYYFGSKEALVVELLSVISARQGAALADIDPATDALERLDALWSRLTSPEFTPFLRTLFEVELRAMEGDERYRAFANTSLHAWLNIVTIHLKPGTSPAAANVVLSALTGLLIDRFSTNDETRTNEAFRALKAALRAGGIV